MKQPEAKVKTEYTRDTGFLYQALIMSLAERKMPDDFHEWQQLRVTDPARAKTIQTALGLTMMACFGLTQQELMKEVDKIIKLPTEEQKLAILNFKKNPPEKTRRGF